MGRKRRRAGGVANTSGVIAPGLSRAERVALAKVWMNPTRGFVTTIDVYRIHGAAQIRRGVTHAAKLALGAPRFSPHRALGRSKTWNAVQQLFDHFQLHIVPERFWNLNAAVSLLVGLD
jgi:hypothetical protein